MDLQDGLHQAAALLARGARHSDDGLWALGYDATCGREGNSSKNNSFAVSRSQAGARCRW